MEERFFLDERIFASLIEALPFPRAAFIWKRRSVAGEWFRRRITGRLALTSTTYLILSLPSIPVH